MLTEEANRRTDPSGSRRWWLSWLSFETLDWQMPGWQEARCAISSGTSSLETRFDATTDLDLVFMTLRSAMRRLSKIEWLKEDPFPTLGKWKTSLYAPAWSGTAPYLSAWWWVSKIPRAVYGTCSSLKERWSLESFSYGTKDIEDFIVQPTLHFSQSRVWKRFIQSGCGWKEKLAE